MNPISVDVKDMLEADSTLGVEFATDLFIGREPATPNSCITIYDTMNKAPQQTLKGKGENYFFNSFQIRVRGIDYEKVFANCMDILTSLHGRANETWNDTLYTQISCSSGPAMLTWDKNNRVIFIINFEAQRREA